MAQPSRSVIRDVPAALRPAGAGPLGQRADYSPPRRPSMRAGGAENRATGDQRRGSAGRGRLDGDAPRSRRDEAGDAAVGVRDLPPVPDIALYLPGVTRPEAHD